MVERGGWGKLFRTRNFHLEIWFASTLALSNTFYDNNIPILAAMLDVSKFVFSVEWMQIFFIENEYL